MKTIIGFDELYVIVEDGWILYAECLYDHETALHEAHRHGMKVMSLEEWLAYIKVVE